MAENSVLEFILEGIPSLKTKTELKAVLKEVKDDGLKETQQLLTRMETFNVALLGKQDYIDKHSEQLGDVAEVLLKLQRETQQCLLTKADHQEITKLKKQVESSQELKSQVFQLSNEIKKLHRQIESTVNSAGASLPATCHSVRPQTGQRSGFRLSGTAKCLTCAKDVRVEKSQLGVRERFDSPKLKPTALPPDEAGVPCHAGSHEQRSPCGGRKGDAWAQVAEVSFRSAGWRAAGPPLHHTSDIESRPLMVRETKRHVVGSDGRVYQTQVVNST